MAELITIPWKVGEGNIVVTVGEGGDCMVASDPNVGDEPRTQTLTFRTTSGFGNEDEDTLDVTQEEADLVWLQDMNQYYLIDSNGDYLCALIYYLTDTNGNGLADADGKILYID